MKPSKKFIALMNLVPDKGCTQNEAHELAIRMYNLGCAETKSSGPKCGKIDTSIDN